MNGKNIEQKISWVLSVNKNHSDEFMRTRLARQLYRVNHGTEIGAFKCMDGRIHVPLVTHTPLGIIRPYRNIGGYFDLGWPLLGENVTDWVEYGITKGRKTLILVTYHYSEGDTHRGCAGFHYDKEATLKFTVNFHRQFNKLFGENNDVVFPVVVGLETDTDSLIWHREDPADDRVFICSDKTSDKPDYLMDLIGDLYPNMDPGVRNDLMPLMQGNIAHIKEVKESGRQPLDMQHREWILAVGRGFDWLHEPNIALIVGPYDPELSKPISTAIKIIGDNMKSGRIDDDGFLVLSSAPFRKPGVDKNRAKLKAKFFQSYVERIIKEEYPDLVPKARYLTAVVDENTRRLEEI